MSARRYEISFRAELTDREVDEVADTLFELGWDDICFRPLDDPPAPPPPTPNVGLPEVGREHYSRADSTRDRDALRAADQQDIQARLK